MPAPSTPAHLGGHFDITNTDQLTLDYLVARYGVRSFLDVGCGPGGMLELARLRGIAALGIDGDPALHRDAIGMVLHDYTTGPLVAAFDHRRGWQVATPAAPVVYAALVARSPTIDLVWAVEFVEHVAAEFIPHFLATFRCGRVLLMSHATPAQGGYHHVNEQPASYWREVLRADGWFEVVPVTEWVREHATDRYIRATGMVWMR